jgi:putative hydrolase
VNDAAGSRPGAGSRSRAGSRPPAGSGAPAAGGVPVSLDEDYHVHSLFSDGVSTLTENVRAARNRGLRRLCLVDHVRRDTAWVPHFVAAVRPLRETAGIEIRAGVEAKILNRAGRLDLPGDPDALAGIDLVLIADHQFPADLGPVQPREMRAAISSGKLSPQEAIGWLAEATASAMGRVRRPVLAHLFSVLPKLGLAESDVPDQVLSLLARRASDTGALVEVNEKWSCPSASTLRAFAAAGVRLVASTDSHDCADVGVYDSVARTLDAVFPGAA